MEETRGQTRPPRPPGFGPRKQSKCNRREGVWMGKSARMASTLFLSPGGEGRRFGAPSAASRSAEANLSFASTRSEARAGGPSGPPRVAFAYPHRFGDRSTGVRRATRRGPSTKTN
jgi:hypothetical protein